MAFWGSNRFHQNLTSVIPNGNPASVKQGAYELSLGGEAYLSGETNKRILEKGDIVIIPPGATALLLTREEIAVPNDAVGFISLKYRAKLPGLINVSGFHVDPGFRGQLVFTVFNAGVERQAFTCGDPLFLLWLADMDTVPDPYTGTRQSQSSLPSDSIARLTAPGVSPAELQAKIEKLQEHRTFVIGIGVAIVLGIVTLVLEGFPFSRLGERFGNAILPAAQPTAQTSGQPAPAPPLPIPPAQLPVQPAIVPVTPPAAPLGAQSPTTVKGTDAKNP